MRQKLSIAEGAQFDGSVQTARDISEITQPLVPISLDGLAFNQPTAEFLMANQVRRLGELVGHLQEEQHRELVRPKSTAGLRQTGRAVTTWAFFLGHLAQPLLSLLRMKM